jgi:hypothetical protein
MTELRTAVQELRLAQRVRLASILARHVRSVDAGLMDREFVWEVTKRFMDGLQEPIVMPGD